MSRSTDVRTPGIAAIAKKWNLPMAKVIKLMNQGAEVEKEHTKSISKAKQVARDHIAERPDYYSKLKKMEKTPISMKEETGVGGVRGLGNVTGDPAVGGVNSYVNTNAMAYEDWNGNKLEWIKKKHAELHNKGIGYQFFDPTKIDGAKNFMNEGMSTEPERDSEVIGDFTGSSRKVSKVEEDATKAALDKISNAFSAKNVKKIIKKERNDPKWQEYKKRKEQEKKIDEVAATYVPPTYQPAQTTIQRAAPQQAQKTVQSGQTKINVRDISPRSQTSGTGTARLSQGGSSGGYNTLKPTTTDVKRNISNRFRTGFGQQGTSLGRQNVSGSSEFKPNSQSRSMNVGKAMGASKQTSPVVKGMSAAGQEASKKIVPKAAGVVAAAGRVARAVSGPEGAAVTAAAEPLAKKMASSYKAGHQSFKPHGDEGEKFSDVAKRMKQPEQQKPQGRSISDYEKQVLTPKASETPKAPENPKVDAPTPPERPKYFSRGQAFGAARGEAGGGEGKFSYDNKSYQTNVTGEPYKPEKQLKQTNVQEDWQKVNRKDKTAGLSQKAVNAYRRENPGSKLQTAVTEKNPSGKRAARRKSFCSRMSGMKKRLTSAKTARDPDSNINKALRRWNCEESVINELKAETLGSYTRKAATSRKKSLEGFKPDIKTWSKREHGIRTAIKKLTTEETKMDNKELINEAIENIFDNNLTEMKDNLLAVLQEKSIEKLEERKKIIASEYFSQ